jgi:hypothetical protein
MNESNYMTNDIYYKTKLNEVLEVMNDELSNVICLTRLTVGDAHR